MGKKYTIEVLGSRLRPFEIELKKKGGVPRNSKEVPTSIEFSRDGLFIYNAKQQLLLGLVNVPVIVTEKPDAPE